MIISQIQTKSTRKSELFNNCSHSKARHSEKTDEKYTIYNDGRIFCQKGLEVYADFCYNIKSSQSAKSDFDF